MTINIAIAGTNGKMSKEVRRIVNEHQDLQEVNISETDVLKKPQVLIDFTVPENSIKNINLCLKNKLPIVIGTTGFTNEQKLKISNASKVIPVVLSPNMSLGVNFLFKLCEMTSGVLAQVADISVIDVHHENKKDSPSGTALKIGEIIQNAYRQSQEYVFGKSNSKNRDYDDSQEIFDEKQIDYDSKRVGDVVGEHTARFELDGEVLELTHKAKDRANFAKGGILAAKWLVNQQPGLYAMDDVLGIKI